MTKMEFKLLTKREFNEHIPSLNRLFKLAFGRDIHPRFFEWRYLENPIDDLLVVVAVEDGEVIANYSASPMLFKYNNSVIKTAISMTTMTHPDHNGKGLFTKLARILYAEMERKSYSTVWGFPNMNSHGAFIKKLDWKDIYEIPSFSLKLTKMERDNYCLPEGYEIAEDNNYELLISDDNSPENKFIIQKNQKYYQWRYLSHPYNQYTNIVLLKNGSTSGNLIFKIYENSIDIIEFNFYSEVEQKIGISYIVDYGIQNGMESITCWCNIYDSSHSILERYGFQNTTPITYFASKEISGYSMSTEFKDYIIQMGDSDVY